MAGRSPTKGRKHIRTALSKFYNYDLLTLNNKKKIELYIYSKFGYITFNNYFNLKGNYPVFSENWWEECAPGIHFFITKEEAKEHNV